MGFDISVTVELVAQILSIFIIITGGTYLANLLKSKSIVDHEHLNLTYQIASLIEGSITSDSQLKSITRVVMEAVKYVEESMKNASNNDKENAAVRLINAAILSLNLRKPLDEDTIRQIIQLACLFTEPTNKQTNK